MKKITEYLQEKQTISIELVPPRNGYPREELFSTLRQIKELEVDFISVTKGAGGSLRGGTVPLCYLAKHKFNITPIAHFTCREMKSYQVENHLVDLYYFGINNVLALRGDPPDLSGQQDWLGDYRYAYQLIEQIKGLNAGRYSIRKGHDKEQDYRQGVPTDFCIGVAAHPEEPAGERVVYLEKKVEAGAEYAITQMLFDADIYSRFKRELEEAGVRIPVMPGIWPLDARWKLESALHKFGATIPAAWIKELSAVKSKKEFRQIGMRHTIELCRTLLENGAPGVHLFVLWDAGLVKEIVSQLIKG